MTIVYPILLGLYPLFFLWSANRAQQPAYVIVPALLATLVYLAAVLFLARRVLRNPAKGVRPDAPTGARPGARTAGQIGTRPDGHNAALAAALVGFDTLAYGQFAGWMTSRFGASPALLLIANLLLLAGLLAWIARRRPARPGLTSVLSFFTAALLLAALIPAANFYLFAAQPVSAHAQPAYVPASGTGGGPSIPNTGADGPRRDVYLILIDNYARQDVFRQRFNFDNSALINGLKERGFLFPACPQGNYPGTVLVVGSMLNMDYLDQLGLPLERFYEESRYQMLKPFIHDNAVMQKFASYGYRTVTTRGYSDLIDIQDSTYYVDVDKNQPFHRRPETLNFQALYFDTTLFSTLNRAVDFYPGWLSAHAPAGLQKLLPQDSAVEERYLYVYRQNVHALDELERLPAAMPSPKFVYAHLYDAHWPYMLNADGSLRLPVANLDDKAAYLEGVRYFNSRLLHIIDTIRASSPVEPVIILQSDHSNTFEGTNRWAGADRLKILSAWSLPGGGDQLLYDRMTPVNNFRLIFNYYFGENLDLLPDVSYGINPDTQEVEPMPAVCMP